jgi:uncharacterized protein (DUF2147 family)
VVRVFDAAAPNPVCERCDGALRDKPVVGMTILRGLRRRGAGYDGGTIMDPEQGRVYRCSVVLRDGGRRLEVRGYVGMHWFGRTQNWQRSD